MNQQVEFQTASEGIGLVAPMVFFILTLSSPYIRAKHLFSESFVNHRSQISIYANPLNSVCNVLLGGDPKNRGIIPSFLNIIPTPHPLH